MYMYFYDCDHTQAEHEEHITRIQTGSPLETLADLGLPKPPPPPAMPVSRETNTFCYIVHVVLCLMLSRLC